jgi:hypothetical protein
MREQRDRRITVRGYYFPSKISSASHFISPAAVLGCSGCDQKVPGQKLQGMYEYPDVRADVK